MEAKEKAWKRVLEAIQKIKSLNVEPCLSLQKDGGGGHFRDYVPFFRGIISLLDQVASLPTPYEVPESTMEYVRGKIEELCNQLNNWTKFNPTDQMAPVTVKSEVKSMAGAAENIWSQFFQTLTSIVLYHSHPEKELEKRVLEIESQAKSLFSQANDTLERIQVQEKAAAQAVEGIKLSAQNQATSSYLKYFHHAKSMYQWLSGGFLLLAILIAIFGGWWGLEHLTPPASIGDWPQLFAHYLPRLLTVTFLLGGFVFALRNFQSSMHNVSVYLHRMIVLQTFQAFRDSAFDEKVKDTILLKAVQSAVDIHQTGYLAGQADAPQINQINEIKKDLTGE